MKLAALALLVVAGAVQADEIVVHAFSWHSKPRVDYTATYRYADGTFAYQEHVIKQYNNANLGLGYRWDSGWNVGYYHNSISKPSLYVAKEWQWTNRFGFALGVATGYSGETSAVLMPLGALTFRQPLTERMTLGVQFAPAIGGNTAVLHTTINYSLQR